MEPLTTAELRALHALARYETATEAAQNAGLSAQTLRNQAASAYRKLGVNGRVDAFRKMGWLRPPRFMPTANDPEPFKDEFEEADHEYDEGLVDPFSARGVYAAGHNRRARASAARLRSLDGGTG